MAELPHQKAADLQGLTCELLTAGALPTPEEGANDGGQSVCACRPLVECIEFIMRNVVVESPESPGQRHLPTLLQTSKVAPVPKSNQAAAPMDKDRYRSICVNSIFTKVLERLMRRRLNDVVEQHGLRAATQCGFRQGSGTLDALFTLQHLVNRARFKGSLLYAVFVDFRKAFDSVRRDLLIERCKQLGMHGQFLDVLVCLYDRIILQVVVNGKTGTPFDTHLGTRQGGELSPLLFGLFIEMLHELICMRLPGAGPRVGALPVPDLLYADDVVLLAETPAAAQNLLDCLALFCRLFGMEVNLAPEKTCMMVFRRPRARMPRGLRLTYMGRDVPVVDSYKYLGLRFNATKNLVPAADALAASASRAMHVVLRRLRRLRITQLDLKCRLFDTMVESILSYGSHVWGPELFVSRLTSRPLETEAEKVHLAYLRYAVGLGSGVCSKVLLRDMHRVPAMFHWVLLAVRWWNKLRGLAPDGDDQPTSSVAYHAWKSDVSLMCEGCDKCWSHQLLCTLESLNVLQAAQWRGAAAESIMQLQFDDATVRAALSTLYQSWWRTGPATHPDPRQAPSAGIDMCTHAQWVHADTTCSMYERSGAPRHLKLCLPFRTVQILMKFRTGWHHLQVHRGRMHPNRIPRAQRLCPLCSLPNSESSWRSQIGARVGSVACVEDLRHFVLECPAYDHIRQQHAALFASPEGAGPYSAEALRRFFMATDQAAVANTLLKMHTHRTHLLDSISPELIQPANFLDP